MKTITFDSISHHHDFFRPLKNLWHRLVTFSAKKNVEAPHIDFFNSAADLDDYVISFRF